LTSHILKTDLFTLLRTNKSVHCKQTRVYGSSLLSFCLTHLDTIRNSHTHTTGNQPFGTLRWTLRFRHTFSHTLLWKSNRHIREIITHTSHNIRKTHNINSMKYWRPLERKYYSENYVLVTYPELVIINFLYTEPTNTQLIVNY